LATAGQELDVLAMLKVKRGGLADSEATEVAVKPKGTPFWLAVMIATPAACRRNISLKVPSKTPSFVATAIRLPAAHAYCFLPCQRIPPENVWGILFTPAVMCCCAASCAGHEILVSV
jgi:hypothetical protein